MPRLTVHVCMNSVKFALQASSASIFVGALLFPDNVQTHLGEGASNRDITVNSFTETIDIVPPPSRWTEDQHIGMTCFALTAHLLSIQATTLN